jgi:hypothetical protein
MRAMIPPALPECLPLSLSLSLSLSLPPSLSLSLPAFVTELSIDAGDPFLILAGLTVHEANLEVKAETFRGFPWVLRLRYIMEEANNLAEVSVLLGQGARADPCRWYNR